MGFTVKSFEQIIADIVAWTVANASQITDMSPGSVIRSFAEGAALSIEELYVGVYLGFRRYLDNIPETAFDFERKSGTTATANVVFSRNVATVDAVAIPAGTRLKTPSGLRFILDSATSIASGNTASPSVQVTAEEVGTAYNVSAASIIVLEDQPSGVDSVTNALPAVGGVDTETNIAYKKRFQDWIEGLGRSNIAGLLAGSLSVEGITSATVVELFPPVADVNVEIYIDDGSASGVSIAKTEEVQTVIDGDGTEDNPGYRAAGVNVQVKKPGVVSQNIEVTVTLISGVDVDQLISDVETALTEYVNTLGVGSDIVYNELVAAVMGVYGIEDCDVTTPSANITIADTQVGRIGTLTITQV